MVTNVLAFLFFFITVTPQHNSQLVQQSEKQMQHYIQSIHHHKNIQLNLWALNATIEGQPAMQSELEDYIRSYSKQDSPLSLFQDFSMSSHSRLRNLAIQMKSPLLLIAYLTTESDKTKQYYVAQQFANKIGYPSDGPVNYKKVVDAILHHKLISKNVLPADSFYPVHFFLFYNSINITLEDIFSKTYLQTISKSWSFSNKKNLKKSIGIATLFKAYYYLRNYSNTLELYEPILNSDIFPNYNVKFQLLRALEYTMYRLGYYHRSIQIIKNHAIPLAEYLGKYNSVVQLKVSQGSNFIRLGRYKTAQHIYKTVLKESNFVNIPTFYIRALNNLAVTYLKTGRIEKYYELAFEALEKVKQEVNFKLQLVILTNLFTTYHKKGNYQSAKTYLKKAQKIALKIDNQAKFAKLIFYEGLLYRDFKKTHLAFQKALQQISSDKNYNLYQIINTEIAFLFEEQEQYKKALIRYNNIITRAKERNDSRNILEATVHKANVFFKMEQQDSVKAILSCLASSNLNILSFDHLVKAKTVRAKYLINTGQPRQAYLLLNPVLKQVVKRSQNSGSLKTGFWQVEPEYLHAFGVMADLLIKLDRPQQAVEVLDRIKTINSAKLYQKPLARSQVLNGKELSLYKRLTDKLNGLRKQLLTASGHEKRQIQLQIDKLNTKKKTLDLKITSKASLKPISIDRIQRKLSANERILHFTFLNDILYIAVISRTSVHFTTLPITKNIHHLFEKATTLLASGKADLNKLHKITHLLKIKELPEHVTKLIIMPDSYFYQLPLAVLPLEQPTHSYSYGSTRYLVEEFKTVYKTSLNDFSHLTTPTEESLDFVGYGVSHFSQKRPSLLTALPYADNEVKKINKTLTSLNNKKILLNNKATEKSFRRYAPDASILHVAAHSSVSAQHPLFSSIYLSSSNSEADKKYSGRIFAYELFEMNLSNDLIMLNSCESAAGSYLQGSGVVGISRALRYAGARSLLLNVWSVNDMLASQFAIRFYHKLNEGYSKIEALRKTRLYFLSNHNANPYYWGSYMLLGNGGAIIHPHRFTDKVAALSFMTIFMIFAFASMFVDWRRKIEK